MNKRFAQLLLLLCGAMTLNCAQTRVVGFQAQVAKPSWVLIPGTKSEIAFTYQLVFEQGFKEGYGVILGLGLQREFQGSPFSGYYPYTDIENVYAYIPLGVYAEVPILKWLKIREAFGLQLRTTLRAERIIKSETSERSVDVSDYYKAITVSPFVRSEIKIGNRLPVGVYYQLMVGYPSNADVEDVDTLERRRPNSIGVLHAIGVELGWSF